MTARYRITHEIARGGMSVVYSAVQLGTERSVALKVAAAQPGSEWHVARLRREAIALGMLSHPSVVRVLDAGDEPDVGPFIALERIRGRTLAGILAARRTISVPDAVTIAVAIAGALAQAHRVGIVHRDVKPGNVMIEWEVSQGIEQVKVIDFGIARLLSHENVARLQRLTLPGDVLGTVEYMAPEQLRRPLAIDARVDQYALATLLYEAASGRLPYPHRDALRAPEGMENGPTPLSEIVAGVPPALDEALASALHPSPQERFPTMAKLREALIAAVPTRPLWLLGGPVANDDEKPQHADTAAPAGRARRRHARVAHVTPLRLTTSDGVKIDGRTEDISESGVLVIASDVCPDGAIVDARFALPMDGTVVSLKARATWVHRGRDRNALGLEFLSIPDDARQKIATYVAIIHRLDASG